MLSSCQVGPRNHMIGWVCTAEALIGPDDFGHLLAGIAIGSPSEPDQSIRSRLHAQVD